MSEAAEPEAAGPEDAAVGPQPAQEVPDGPGAEATGPVEVRIRRAPRFGRFTVAGAVLGAVLALVAASWQLRVRPESRPTLIDGRSVMGYFAVIGALAGGLLALALALLLDRRSWRRVDRDE